MPRLSRLLARSAFLAIAAIAVAACSGWENTYRGTASYTAAAGSDGRAAHDTIESTVVVSVCGPGVGPAEVRIGDDCALRGGFQPDETGGTILVRPGAACTLPLTRGRVGLRVTSGVVTIKGDVTEAAIGGNVTGPDGGEIHADFRWTGQRTSWPQDPHCGK